MITYKMHFLRTGSTGALPGKRYVGQLDLPLCEQGIQDLYEMRRNFAYPRAQVVYSSPLSRCVQTAEILYPDTQIIELQDLMDLNLGAFEGKTFEQLRHTEDFSLWISDSYKYPPPGGEDITEFTRRIADVTGEIFARMMHEQLTEIAVITHGGVIMSLLAAIGLPKLPLHEWVTENGGGFTLLFTPQLWMQGASAEVYARIPAPTEEESDENDF